MQYRSYRFPCDYPVVVHADAGRRRDARLTNISPEGARLTGLDELRPGATLRVEIGPCCQPRLAEVRWSRGGAIGLRFATPLGAREMAVIRKTGGHAGPPVHAPARQCLTGAPR